MAEPVTSGAASVEPAPSTCDSRPRFQASANTSTETSAPTTIGTTSWRRRASRVRSTGTPLSGEPSIFIPLQDDVPAIERFPG
ncbi:hypothetical protein GCM10027030_23630 [Luteococcus sediminum]